MLQKNNTDLSGGCHGSKWGNRVKFIYIAGGWVAIDIAAFDPP